MPDSFSHYASRLRDFIARSTLEMDVTGRVNSADADAEFTALSRQLFALQFANNPAFRGFCAGRGVTPETLRHWRDIPSAPTAAFKEGEFSCLPADERTAVFFSSGTSQQRPSRHFHHAESLELYAASFRPWFQRHLLGDPGGNPARNPIPLLALTPPPSGAPNSSLVYMLDGVMRSFGSPDSMFFGVIGRENAWEIGLGRLGLALEGFTRADRPVLLLGTAFNFVHLLEDFAAAGRCLSLAKGSRLMETGGYKGRSRELPRAELHAQLTTHLGLPPASIVAEYGMSELSSQAYDAVCGQAGPRRFRFPPWARARVISPETGNEVGDGGTGLLHVLDLANAWSVLAVQTEDLAVRRGDGFELLGRARNAEARGCSLMSAGGS
jgi:hypothetical protein